MEINSIIAIGTGVVVGLWGILTYNSLIRLRNDVKKAFSGIDVQLKRRTDLIPNLVKTVKGYASHEKGLLTEVTKARTSIMDASNAGDVKGMANGENLLSGALKSVFAVAENYPDLKANTNFIQLQEELSETEDQIAAARRIYNENATYLNNKVETFPNNLMAKLGSFKKATLFEATIEDKKAVSVEF